MPRGSAQGIALLEVLLAGAIFTTSVVVIANALITASSAMRESRRYQAAVLFLENQMFDFLRKPIRSDVAENTSVAEGFDYTQSLSGFPAGNTLLNKLTLRARWGSGQKFRGLEIVTAIFKTKE